MKALGKALGLIALGLLLLIVALGFALTHLFDPNDYKDEIRELARERAGVELDIRGDIGWSLFPWLGLELHDTSVASTQAPETPLADLRMLGLSVRVLPLLSRELRMSAITVNGLNLNLAHDEQGRGNWEGIGEPASADATQAGQEPASGSDAPRERKPLALDIDSLTVSDARVTYRDARSGQQYQAESIDLATGAIRENEPVPVRLSAYFGSNQPVLRARTELQGALRYDTERGRYQLEGLRMSGEASGEPLRGETLNYSAQGELWVDLQAQTATWQGLKFSANQLRGLGELSVSELQGEPKVAGTLSIAEFDLAAFLRDLGQKLPAMADEQALSRVELVSRLAGTSNSLALEELNLQVDGSRFEGRLAVDDFTRQALRVELVGDRLDLDRYLPPPSEEEQAADTARQQEVLSTEAGIVGGTTPLPPEPTQQAWSDEPVLPLEQLRRLDTRVALNLNQLILDGLPLQAFRLRARSTGGLLQLEEFAGDLHGGRVEATASLDVRPATPLLGFKGRLAEVPVERLLEAQSERVVIEGLLDLGTDLTTQGNSQQAWINNLDGRLDFVVDNGVLIEANLEQQICRAIATLNRKPLTTVPSGRNTPFRELKGSLVLQDGVATNPDLRASIPGLSVAGRGDVDLRVLGMDYRIGVALEGDKSDMPDPACQVNERYVGLEWPLRCRGPMELGARACRLDQDGMGRIAAKLAGEKLNETIEEKLGDKVSPELKNALKGLFER